MPTSASTYRLLACAIENRVRLCCDYGGKRREICPIILGLGANNEEKLLAYQVDGETKEGSISAPDWRCFLVSELRGIETAEGEWGAGNRHSQSQKCVLQVDYDAN